MARSLWTVASFGLLGLLWGVLARLWMRFISTNPEFTWGGTIYVVAAPTVIGTLAGVAHAARRRQWPRVRAAQVVGGGSVILLGVAAGVVMLPSLLFGALAAARTDWPRWIRVGLVVLAIAPIPAVLVQTWMLGGPLRGLAATVWYLALVGGMILIVRLSFAPLRRPVAELAGAQAARPAGGTV